jgi:hypothetical protein
MTTTCTYALFGFCILVEGSTVPFILADRNTGQPSGYDTREDAMMAARDHEVETGLSGRVIPFASRADHGAPAHDDAHHKWSVEFSRDLMRRHAPTGVSWMEFITTPNPADEPRGLS